MLFSPDQYIIRTETLSRTFDLTQDSGKFQKRSSISFAKVVGGTLSTLLLLVDFSLPGVSPVNSNCIFHTGTLYDQTPLSYLELFRGPRVVWVGSPYSIQTPPPTDLRIPPSQSVPPVVLSVPFGHPSTVLASDSLSPKSPLLRKIFISHEDLF